MDNELLTKPRAEQHSTRPAAGSDIIRPAPFKPAGERRRRKSVSLNPVSAVLALLLLICATLAWFLFAARSVTIDTAPADAQLSLSGGFKLRLADHYLVHPGTYTLEAKALGYYPLRVSLEVTEAQNQSFQYNLEKLPGHLTVNTQPATAAEIWLDDQPIGPAATRLSDIAAGPHTLTVKSKRFRDYEQTLEIQGKDQHQELEVVLEPAWAEVSIATQPPGATLLVDGKAMVGSTPFTAEIIEGERNIILKLSGYKAWQETLTVHAGENIQLQTVTLEKADGLVTLHSVPQGAGVTVNGEYQGQTPLEVALAPGEKYQFTLYKDGYQPAHKELEIQSGEDRQLTLNLQAQLGEISIRSQPADAQVYIDGHLMGKAGQTFKLPARQTRVTVKKEGYVDYQTRILPRAGLEQVVAVKLKTAAQAKWEAIKPQIVSPGGQTLKLFKPKATFTMGASRREQGRRANEVMRKVSLSRPFYLGIKEVTNAEYRRLNKFHSSGHVKGNSLNNDNYPVVNLTWQQAAAYCNWLSEQEKLPPYYRVKDKLIVGFNPESTGYRLPTEAEWAWAARYQIASNSVLKYPWGQQLPPPKGAGNYADRSAAALLGNILTNYNDNFAVTAPVANFAVNEKGLYDLGGNVAEWISDFYDIQTGLSLKINTDPMGPDSGDYHVIRGSSWAHGTVTDLRLSFRDYGTKARNDVGFRIARFVE